MMIWKIFINENMKNIQRSMLWIEVATLGVLVALLLSLMFASLQLFTGGANGPAGDLQQMEPTLVWPGSLSNSIGFAGGNMLGGMLIILFVGAATAQEYTWRTLHLWLSRGVPRPALLLGKFAAFILPALLLPLAAWVAGGLVTIPFTLHIKGSLGAGQVNFASLLVQWLATAYTLLPYAGLAFLLAVASRSVVAAIGGGMAYSLLGEGLLTQLLTLVGGGLEKIGQFLPSGFANSLLSGLQGGSPGADGLLSPPLAAGGIALWTLALLGLALFVFHKQDIAE